MPQFVPHTLLVARHVDRVRIARVLKILRFGLHPIPASPTEGNIASKPVSLMAGMYPAISHPFDARCRFVPYPCCCFCWRGRSSLIQLCLVFLRFFRSRLLHLFVDAFYDISDVLPLLISSSLFLLLLLCCFWSWWRRLRLCGRRFFFLIALRIVEGQAVVPFGRWHHLVDR